MDQREPIYLFVYGTLRMHESNHCYLANSILVARQSWTEGMLVDSGFGYPALVQATIRSDSLPSYVYGELYEITPKVLEKVDKGIGYYGPDCENLKERILQTIYTDTDTFEAYMYVSPHDILGGILEKPFSDWKYERLKKENQILYFAYGSCMDNRRFRKHRVAHHFQDVLGSAKLRGYSLQFTRKARDGGRADIVENLRAFHTWVEGKLYRVSQEALNYLYIREGVKNGIYRPAIVDVVVEDTLYRDVLTFVVIHKQRETQPPKWYMEELLQGAKGVVSDTYYEWLEYYLKNCSDEPRRHIEPVRNEKTTFS